MPEFSHRDPAAAAFWSERFEQRFMPWDRHGVPAALRDYVRRAPQPRVTLIPGCGTGYEVAYLSEAGWDVTAIDFSPAAVVAARASLGPWAERVMEADFFAFEPPRPVEFIYECAFLCALPPRLRPQVAQRWAELLPPGGILAGLFFFDHGSKGPPFGMMQAELDALLASRFECMEDKPVSDSIPIFSGKERWQVWRRLPRLSF